VARQFWHSEHELAADVQPDIDNIEREIKTLEREAKGLLDMRGGARKWIAHLSS
jgi:hypothetical protein